MGMNLKNILVLWLDIYGKNDWIMVFFDYIENIDDSVNYTFIEEE